MFWYFVLFCTKRKYCWWILPGLPTDLSCSIPDYISHTWYVVYTLHLLQTRGRRINNSQCNLYKENVSLNTKQVGAELCQDWLMWAEAIWLFTCLFAYSLLGFSNCKGSSWHDFISFLLPLDGIKHLQQDGVGLLECSIYYVKHNSFVLYFFQFLRKLWRRP